MRKRLRVSCRLYVDHPHLLPRLRAHTASLTTQQGDIHCPLFLRFSGPDRPRASPFSAIWRGKNARLTRAPLRLPRASFSAQRRHIHCAPLTPTLHRVLLSVSPIRPCISLLSAIWRRRSSAPAPAPAPAADIRLSEPAPVTVKKSILLLPDIIIQESSQGIQDPDNSTGTDTTVRRCREMLGVPLVDWRGRLDEDELARYYPQEHANEQFARRLQSMVRSKTRSAAARRRDHARRRRQTAPTTAPTSPTISLIASRTRI